MDFRLAVKDFDIEQNDWGSANFLEAEFGLRDCYLSVQPRGHCKLAAGRALAWSNVWQTRRMAPDAGGVTGTLVQFHLVDPTLRIRSTSTVPPQQKEWLYPTQNVDVVSTELSELVAAKVQANVSKMGMTDDEAMAICRVDAMGWMERTRPHHLYG